MLKKIKYQSSSFEYTILGEGKPVLLLHGFGEDHRIWFNQANFLSPHFKVIIPDLPGTGNPSLLKDDTIEGMAEMIHKILQQEEIETCHVIGHSMGGYIALALVEKYHSQISALGLFHSTAYADSKEKKESRKKACGLIMKYGASAFLRTSIPTLFAEKNKSERLDLIDELINRTHNFFPEALVYYYQAMINRPDRTAILKNSKVPILFIIGKDDAAVPMSDILRQCHLPEKVYIHVLQNSGHMGMVEEPEVCNEILINFLLEVEIYNDL
jgi:pimeloyl-ACP methyl ester carboxylesterase